MPPTRSAATTERVADWMQRRNVVNRELDRDMVEAPAQAQPDGHARWRARRADGIAGIAALESIQIFDAGAGSRRRSSRRSRGCGEKQLSSLAAMRANAGDFDHWTFRRKARRATGAFQCLRDGATGRFADGAAAFADQEHDRIAAGVIVHAGDERVAAFDAMDQAVVPQKIERAIDRDRRRTAVCRASRSMIS